MEPKVRLGEVETENTFEADCEIMTLGLKLATFGKLSTYKYNFGIIC